MDEALKRVDHNQDPELLIEQLIDLYGEHVKKLAYTYVKDWAIAEDVTQEVFISVYKNLHRFRGDSSYKTWIYKIAMNKSKDAIKTRFMRPKKLLGKLKEQNEVYEPSAENNVFDNIGDLKLSEAVMQLPVKYREVIMLFYYEGLKLEEIQSVTKLNLSTVKTRLRRAKAMLRDLYEEGVNHG
ncbi:MAG: sigma-70 family RNA polymerase sigma factor [Tuberibacillus sp.]